MSAQGPLWWPLGGGGGGAQELRGCVAFQALLALATRHLWS